jgi:NAD(P)-dependent dehydrogenase (short-subunit alcohol dehydrogenase family)
VTDAPQTLTGRVALVTGASRGIGRAIARRLAAHGARVVVTASPRSVAGLTTTCARIVADGGEAAWLATDLADAAARADLVARAARYFGPIDILVNNAAAISAYAPPSHIDLAARQAMFAVNVDAPLDLIQQALPAMQQGGWGRILNLSSDTTAQPAPPYPGPAKFVHALAAYGASKCALERYGEGLAAELTGSGITAHALKPYRIARSESAEAVAAELEDTHPEWIEPVEMMAEAAYRLITDPPPAHVHVSRALVAAGHGTLRALDGVIVLGNAAFTGRVPAAAGESISPI